MKRNKPTHQKVMLCNIGWSENYAGESLQGDHKFIKETKGDGSERWNFEKRKNGYHYGYIRGIRSDHHLPQMENPRRKNWTIVFYAKDPCDGLLKIVGYYRFATILADWNQRPGPIQIKGRRGFHAYCVKAPAKHSRLFPVANRHNFGKGLGQAGYIYLTDKETEKVKPKYKKLFQRVIPLLHRNVSKIPARVNQPEHSAITTDPMYRKLVEKRSVKFVKGVLRHEKFFVTDVSKRNLGYDLSVKRGAHVLKIEVKGTAGAAPNFIITRNELDVMKTDPSSRIAIVTRVLVKPRLQVVNGMDVEDVYRIRPLQYEAYKVKNKRKILSRAKRYFHL
jgi:hypothetical protein